MLLEIKILLILIKLSKIKLKNNNPNKIMYIKFYISIILFFIILFLNSKLKASEKNFYNFNNGKIKMLPGIRGYKLKYGVPIPLTNYGRSVHHGFIIPSKDQLVKQIFHYNKMNKRLFSRWNNRYRGINGRDIYRIVNYNGRRYQVNVSAYRRLYNYNIYNRYMLTRNLFKYRRK